MAKMKIFYSGVEGNQPFTPEKVLKKPDVMVSYWNIFNRKSKEPSPRVDALMRRLPVPPTKRKKGRGEKG